MKVKKMWANMLGMICRKEEGSHNEPVAVIPWDEWEKIKDAIISIGDTTEHEVTEDERLDAELNMLNIYRKVKEAPDGNKH